MSLTEDLLKYSRLWGPSGEEDLVIDAVVAELASLGLDPTVDPLGNVTAVLHAPEPGYPTAMISAHLDEVGFVVRKVEQDGFLRVHRVGGTHDRVTAGQYLRLGTAHGFIEGVVGVKAKHASSPEELAASVQIDNAYVDILASSAEDARRSGVEVGTLATFATEPRATGSYVRGKALDDRAGLAVIIDVARKLREQPPRAGVVLVATVQEEFSVRGGTPAARRLAPDLAFCVDIAVATDTPDLAALGDVRLGAGPVLTRFTRASLNGIIPNPKLRRFVEGVAREAGIPLQNAVLQGGLTDGSFMQYEGEGIPTLDLSFPVRYTHTPIETAHLGDLAQTSQLLAAALRALPQDFDLARGNRISDSYER
jgi:putative aminopeptidase FrvX